MQSNNGLSSPSRRASAISPSHGSFVRKKDAQRLLEQRQKLARSLSGMSLHLSVHGDGIDFDSEAAKQRRSINLAELNNAHRSQAPSVRQANMGVIDLSTKQPSPKAPKDIVPPPVVVSNHELSTDGVSAGGQGVGGGPVVPTVSTQDVGRDGGASTVASPSDALSKKDDVRSTPSMIQQQPNQPPSSTVQPSKVPSNRAIPTITDMGDETRSPSNTAVAIAQTQAPLSPRRISRPINTTYTGKSLHNVGVMYFIFSPLLLLTLPPNQHNTGPRYHILVVDDSALSRKMLMNTLKAIGHTCEEAEDGQIAVDKVKERGLTVYDAILMDFIMVSLLLRPSLPLLLTSSPPPHAHALVVLMSLCHVLWSCHVLSCLIFSCLILSCLVLSCLVLSCLVLS